VSKSCTGKVIVGILISWISPLIVCLSLAFFNETSSLYAAEQEPTIPTATLDEATIKSQLQALVDIIYTKKKDKIIEKIRETPVAILNHTFELNYYTKTIEEIAPINGYTFEFFEFNFASLLIREEMWESLIAFVEKSLNSDWKPYLLRMSPASNVIQYFVESFPINDETINIIRILQEKGFEMKARNEKVPFIISFIKGLWKQRPGGEQQFFQKLKDFFGEAELISQLMEMNYYGLPPIIFLPVSLENYIMRNYLKKKYIDIRLSNDLDKRERLLRFIAISYLDSTDPTLNEKLDAIESPWKFLEGLKNEYVLSFISFPTKKPFKARYPSTSFSRKMAITR